MPERLTCTPKRLPRDLWISAAKIAVDINPVNHPPLHPLLSVMPSFSLKAERVSVVTTKCWRATRCN
jgi:hypothetical protein